MIYIVYYDNEETGEYVESGEQFDTEAEAIKYADSLPYAAQVQAIDP